MTNRVADDFSAIRKRLDELTQEELKQVQTDSGDEHTIAVQPSTGKRYKWINGSWTEEEYSVAGYAPEWSCAKAIDDQLLSAEECHTLLDYMI